MSEITNKTALDYIYKVYSNWDSILFDPHLKEDEMTKLKLDVTARKIEFENVVIKPGPITEGYFISLLDKKKDFYGIPHSENPELLKLAQRRWKDDSKEIQKEELKKIFIHQAPYTINVGNFRLEEVMFYSYFNVYLIDKKRNWQNKWTDAAVTMDRVIDTLLQFKMTKQKYAKYQKKHQSEVEWNNDLEAHFKNDFASVKQGNGEIDLDIGRGKCGIELKWADKVKQKHTKNNVIGQLGGYARDKDYDNLILCVAGFAKDQDNLNLQDLEVAIKKDYGCGYIYLEVS